MTAERRVGRPAVTTRAEVLAAARRVIDRDGWERLTMRRLAAELGIGVTTLYRQVRDREELLLLLLDEYTKQIPRPIVDGRPRQRMVGSATALHDGLAAWPWVAEILTADGFLGLLGDSARSLVEAILAGAVDAGMTDEEAAGAFRTIWYYTAGEILVRAHTARDRVTARYPGASAFESVDAERMPVLAAIGDDWPRLAARDTYRAGLEALVDGLIAQTGSSKPRGLRP